MLHKRKRLSKKNPEVVTVSYMVFEDGTKEPVRAYRTNKKHDFKLMLK